MFEITPQGVQVETYEEIFSTLVDLYKGIYGNDINVDQESPDGQRIGIESKVRLDLQAFAAALVNQSDPDFANGINLNRIIKLSGLFLRGTSRSQVTINVTTDRNLTLTSDYTIKDNLDQRWVINDQIAVLAGTTAVTFFSQQFGQIEADPNTITSPVTIILGVTSVTNPLAASPGKDEETEPDLRSRRNQSTENPSLSTIGKMFSVLANLADVTDVVVYENDADSYDAVRDILGHTIWVVIENGALSEIAEAMAKNKTGGTGMKGLTTQSFSETVNRPDGTSFTFVHQMRFDIRTLVNLSINITATRKNPTSPVNIPLLKSELAKRLFRIGENAIASELYQFGYKAGTNFILSDLEISNGGPFTDESLFPGYGSKFIILVGNITVTEVI